MHIERDKCSMKKASFSQYFFPIFLAQGGLGQHPNSSFLRCKTKNPHERVSLRLCYCYVCYIFCSTWLGVSRLFFRPLLFQNFGYKVCSYPIIASMRRILEARVFLRGSLLFSVIQLLLCYTFQARSNIHKSCGNLRSVLQVVYLLRYRTRMKNCRDDAMALLVPAR